MSNEDGSVWLVFNGEIYDFELFASRLGKSGHRFASDTDSEVLVTRVRGMGDRGPCRAVNGMFAFAIWDAQRAVRCTLSATGLGKKPLYYGWHEGRFAFASELKALWALAAGGWKVRRISRSVSVLEVPPGPGHDLRGCVPAAAGAILTVTPTGYANVGIGDLSFARQGASPAFGNSSSETDAVLTAAVRAAVAERRAARGVPERGCRQQLCREPHGGGVEWPGPDLLDGHERRSA